MTAKRLEDICELIGGELVGAGDIEIRGVSGIKEAKAHDITFVANPKYLREITLTEAAAVIVSQQVTYTGKPLVRVPDPYVGFVKTLEMFSSCKRPTECGVHETAIIGENVQIGEMASIQAYAYIGDNVQVGDGVIISPFVYIGNEARVGDETLIYPNVTVREATQIGARVIIHSGAVIGSDGFGFATVGNRHHKIPQIGTVVIEDDVEIGANTTIDRSTMPNNPTIIKRGAKLDNLVQIAHNVVIGEDCLIAAQVGIAGSSELKDRVTMAGRSGAVGHITIGEDTTVFGKGVATKDIPAGSYVSGFPAKPHTQELRIQASLSRLPEMVHQFSQLQRRIAELEAKLEDQEAK